MASRFAPGTFTPAPNRASMTQIVASQTKLETTLIWRHGEQMLLTLIIPLAMLIGFTVVPVLDLHDPLSAVLPMVLAISAMSAGFTAQAIAVGFDRRYGALKRIGASAVPKWGIITGKVLAVAITVSLQFLIFAVVAFALGFRAGFGAWVLAYTMLLIGTGVFTSLGLLMGGTLGAEMILGLANLIWFILLGAATFSAVGPHQAGLKGVLLNLLPSVALTDAISAAFTAHIHWGSVLVLIVWGVAGAAAAIKFFQFDMKND